jgi:hypothetical protein
MNIKEERAFLQEKIDAIIDTYHGSSFSDLQTIISLRRDLAVYQYRLAAHMRHTYKAKAYSYARRKYWHAKAIHDALMQDIAENKKKPRAINQLEHYAEALEQTHTNRQMEAEDEAQWEGVRAQLSAAKEVLSAMNQEISNEKWEKQTTHYQNKQHGQPDSAIGGEYFNTVGVGPEFGPDNDHLDDDGADPGWEYRD